ncbi:MAG: sulfite exporter TauE/SafE family protein [Burkholderiales bacterium]
MDPLLLTVIAATFAAAGLVKGVSAIGLPAVAMALLSFVLPPLTAAALMVVPSFATNIAQCGGPHFRVLVARLWPLWLGLLMGAVLSPFPDLSASGGIARLMLGLALVAYGLWGLLRVTPPAIGRNVKAIGAIAGLLSGTIAAGTGIFVMPLVPYLQTLRLDREALIQALALSFTVGAIALSIRLGRIGGLTASLDLAAYVVAVAGAFFGLWIGTLLRRRMPPMAFQRAVLVVLMLLGVLMIGKAWW